MPAHVKSTLVSPTATLPIGTFSTIKAHQTTPSSLSSGHFMPPNNLDLLLCEHRDTGGWSGGHNRKIVCITLGGPEQRRLYNSASSGTRVTSRCCLTLQLHHEHNDCIFSFAEVIRHVDKMIPDGLSQGVVHCCVEGGGASLCCFAGNLAGAAASEDAPDDDKEKEFPPPELVATVAALVQCFREIADNSEGVCGAILNSVLGVEVTLPVTEGKLSLTSSPAQPSKNSEDGRRKDVTESVDNLKLFVCDFRQRESVVITLTFLS